MYSDPSKINLLMNLIYKHPKELVPFSARMYENYFSAATVPAEQKIFDNNGNVSIVLVSKTTVLNHFKKKYGFTSRKDIAKALEEEHADDNL
jgi:hypothetical protein